MMKILLIQFLLLFVYINAQQNNLVEYTITTKQGAKDVTKEYLIFNDTALYYASVVNHDNLNYEDEKLEKNQFNFEPIYVNLKTDTLYQERIGIFSKNKTNYSRFVLKEISPKVKWKITKETQKILGYTVYKATTKFRGRDYIAWFSPDLPYNYGPWKLGGLPGLILKVENELFDYDAIRIVLNSDKIPTLPILKSMENAKYQYPLRQAIEFENNWLKFLESNVIASLSVGQNAQEEPLRRGVREFSFDE